MPSRYLYLLLFQKNVVTQLECKLEFGDIYNHNFRPTTGLRLFTQVNNFVLYSMCSLFCEKGNGGRI